MAKFSASINLLANKEKTLDLIVTWALTIGRVLVITVEIVAIGAFLYRFSLDNQLQDLRTKIKQQQAIIVYQKDSENKYRNLQDRLAAASLFSSESTKDVQMFKEIVSFAPSDLTFKILDLAEDKLQVEATVNSVSSLSSFVEKLKTYTPIDAVSLDKIENNTSNATISVGITATLKKQGEKNAISN